MLDFGAAPRLVRGDCGIMRGRGVVRCGSKTAARSVVICGRADWEIVGDRLGPGPRGRAGRLWALAPPRTAPGKRIVTPTEEFSHSGSRVGVAPAEHYIGPDRGRGRSGEHDTKTPSSGRLNLYHQRSAPPPMRQECPFTGAVSLGRPRHLFDGTTPQRHCTTPYSAPLLIGDLP